MDSRKFKDAMDKLERRVEFYNQLKRPISIQTASGYSTLLDIKVHINAGLEERANEFRSKYFKIEINTVEEYIRAGVQEKLEAEIIELKKELGEGLDLPDIGGKTAPVRFSADPPETQPTNEKEGSES